MNKTTLRPASLLIGALLLASGVAQATPNQYQMTTHVPSSIILPDSVETSIGTLDFFDGMPSKETIQKSYDFLDLQRATSVFLDEMRATSLVAMRDGFESVGARHYNQVLITESFLDSKSLFLTPNSESIYATNFLDLGTDGPMVIEAPGPVLGMLDDMWFRHIADFGLAGADGGKGGKYLVLPPGYQGEVPEGYYTVQSKTYGVWVMMRGFAVNGDPAPTVEMIKNNLKIYPLHGEAGPMEFIDFSGLEMNTVHANDYHFFEELNSLIQREHIDAISPEERGRIALLGIEKGKPFNPDQRMRRILNDGAVIGASIARASTYAPREKGMYIYDDSHTWWNPFAIGNHEFKQDGWVNADAMTSFHYVATGITPAMAIEMVGVGSQYGAASQDSNGDWLDGGKSYKVTLPANIPAKDFWSVTVYDGQTRSMLQTDQRLPSVSSQVEGVQQNADGTTDIYFGPKAPKGFESNWVQTVPGKSWFTILRLYGPLESWFDQTWRPGDIELLD